MTLALSQLHHERKLHLANKYFLKPWHLQFQTISVWGLDSSPIPQTQLHYSHSVQHCKHLWWRLSISHEYKETVQLCCNNQYFHNNNGSIDCVMSNWLLVLMNYYRVTPTPFSSAFQCLLVHCFVSPHISLLGLLSPQQQAAVFCTRHAQNQKAHWQTTSRWPKWSI